MRPLIRMFSLAAVCLLLAGPMPGDAQAARLSDLIKKNPKLFLPTQILPGKTATFTLQGKPGQTAEVILSPTPSGQVLSNGLSLRVGRPTLKQSGVIPASGVLELKMKMPEDDTVLGESQFVEGIVWSAPDQSDAQAADLLGPDGQATNNNELLVGAESDPGSTLLVPGDPSVSALMRSINTLQDVGDDPRKKGLIDQGDINRRRLLDRNLTPSMTGP